MQKFFATNAGLMKEVTSYNKDGLRVLKRCFYPNSSFMSRITFFKKGRRHKYTITYDVTGEIGSMEFFSKKKVKKELRFRENFLWNDISFNLYGDSNKLLSFCFYSSGILSGINIVHSGLAEKSMIFSLDGKVDITFRNQCLEGKLL
jgi:antitoxin component YwqK of YwqJK toxin-antitoxin module